MTASRRYVVWDARWRRVLDSFDNIETAFACWKAVEKGEPGIFFLLSAVVDKRGEIIPQKMYDHHIDPESGRNVFSEWAVRL